MLVANTVKGVVTILYNLGICCVADRRGIIVTLHGNRETKLALNALLVGVGNAVDEASVDSNGYVAGVLLLVV